MSNLFESAYKFAIFSILRSPYLGQYCRYINGSFCCHLLKVHGIKKILQKKGNLALLSLLQFTPHYYYLIDENHRLAHRPGCSLFTTIRKKKNFLTIVDNRF